MNKNQTSKMLTTAIILLSVSVIVYFLYPSFMNGLFMTREFLGEDVSQTITKTFENKSINYLIGKSESRVRLFRWGAAVELSKRKDERVVPTLINGTKSKDDQMRIYAFVGLSKIADGRVMAYLTDVVNKG